MLSDRFPHTYAPTLLNILGIGLLTESTTFPVGATAYTNSSVITLTTPTPLFLETLTGGAGWYTVFTAGVDCGGAYCATGLFTLKASAAFTDTQFFQVNIQSGAGGSMGSAALLLCGPRTFRFSRRQGAAICRDHRKLRSTSMTLHRSR